MIIDHIGIVVKSLQEGILHWKRVFGYNQMTEPVINNRQKVKVVFLSKEKSLTIKLLEPIDETSSVYTFSKRGGGLHHLCGFALSVKILIASLTILKRWDFGS